MSFYDNIYLAEPETPNMDDFLNVWHDEQEAFLKADFIVAVKHEEYADDEYDAFVQDEWTKHLEELEARSNDY